MKKITLLLAIILCSATTIFAQDEKKIKLGLTFYPTVNAFKPDVDGIDRSGNGIGFSYGLLTDYVFGDNYAFSSGIQISTFTGSMTYKDRAFPDVNKTNNFAAVTESSYQLKYIDIPLTLKLRTNEIGYITYYGQFGLGLGINIKATQDLETTYGQDNKTLTSEDANIADEIKLFRTSLVVGGGIEYSISGNTAIQIGLTFNNGFSNILNGNMPEIGEDGNVLTDETNTEIKYSDKKRSATNNIFALNLGIFF